MRGGNSKWEAGRWKRRESKGECGVGSGSSGWWRLVSGGEGSVCGVRKVKERE